MATRAARIGGEGHTKDKTVSDKTVCMWSGVSPGHLDGLRTGCLSVH